MRTFKMRRRLTVLGMVLLALVLAACGSETGSAAVPTPASIPTAESPLPTPSPEATQRPVPTPTTAAAVDPETRTDAIDVQKLSDLAYGYLYELAEDIGPRESATAQEREAAEYLFAKLREMGYESELQDFTMEFLSPEGTSLTIDGTGPTDVEAAPLRLTAIGTGSGTLVPIGLGLSGDLPAEGLAGKVALVRRGTITFEEKVRRAADAGATAVVIYNNQPGTFNGQLRTRSAIPAVAISQEDGQLLEELAAGGEVQTTVDVQNQLLTSQNVIGERAGARDGVIVLGAHYDTIAGVAGANDNASGTATLLTVATVLADQSPNTGLRFIAFGSEELGLRGSRFYVNGLDDVEKGRIVAMFNFDALGTGSTLSLTGTRELVDRLLVLADRLGIPASRGSAPIGASSDHASFEAAGIPNVAFSADDFSRIHSPQDTIEHVSPNLLGSAAALALAFLQSLNADL